jgi:hypothetical protein
MARYMEIVLKKRDVRCVARLLDEEAPRTCEAVWKALPLEGQVYHAKFASNEIYALVATFADEEPGRENRTLVPTAGDILYFYLDPGNKAPLESRELDVDGRGLIDLAVFYDRNNLLISPTEGPMPGNHFAVIVRNQEAMRQAGHSVWRDGFAGERLIYRRLEGDQLKEWALDEGSHFSQ